MAEFTIEQQRAIAIARARARKAAADQAAAQEAASQGGGGGAEQEALPTTQEGWVKRGMDQQQQGRAMLELADMGLSVASGIPASIIGGAASAVDLMVHGNMDSAADVYDNVSGFFQYAPKTEGGRRNLGKVGEVIENVMTKGRDANIALVGENRPGVATAVETAVLGIPELVTGAALPASIAARRAAQAPEALANMERSARRLGIDLNNNTIKESVIEAARRLTGGDARATSGAEELHKAAAAAEKKSRDLVDAAFTAARSSKAELSLDPILTMTRRAEEELVKLGADLGEETTLAKRIKELENIRDTVIGRRKGNNERIIPGESKKIVGPDGKPMAAESPVRIPLDELEVMNQRLTKDITNAYASGKPSDAHDLRILRRHINDMLDDQFNRDMVYGDKAAKERWVNARLANRRHKERFSDNRVINDIVRNQYTAKDTVKLIFGASEIGHRAEAVNVVRRLKDVLGPDAPELQSLRNSVLADLYDPLFKDTPGWNATLERMRRVRRDDAALLRELEVSEADLDFMERAVKVAKHVQTKADFDGKGLFSQAISRFVFGHDIARAGMRQKLVNMVMDKALGVGQKTHDQLLKEFAQIGQEGPLMKSSDPRVVALNLSAALQSEINNANQGEDPENR